MTVLVHSWIVGNFGIDSAVERLKQLVGEKFGTEEWKLALEQKKKLNH